MTPDIVLYLFKWLTFHKIFKRKLSENFERCSVQDNSDGQDNQDMT
jgi:hypothetical protein